MLNYFGEDFYIVKKQKLRLGALLVERGLIDEQQLDEALKAQVIYGGRLGTNLVELGYIDDEALAYFLSEELEVPYAHPNTIFDVPKNVISIIPRNLAEKYKILPIELKRKRLKLAMSNPMDYEAVNEISFITGFIVEPMVTPDARLMDALEKHYGIAKEKRFRPTLDAMKDVLPLQSDFQKQSAMPPPISPPPPPVVPPPPPSLVLPPPMPPSAPAPTDEQAAEKIREKVEALKGKRKSMLLEKTFDGHPSDSDPAGESPLSIDLKNAASREAVAEALIKFALEHVPRAAIFVAKRDRAIGWKGAGDSLTDHFVKRIMIPLTVPGILREAAEKRIALKDNPEKAPMDKMLRRQLKIPNGFAITATSVYFQRAVVCFLLGIAEHDAFDESKKESFLQAAEKAGDAFERLIGERTGKEKSG